MSDGSGIDFGTIRSRCLSEEGRKKMGEISPKKCSECANGECRNYRSLFTGECGQYIPPGVIDPKQHEQVK